MKLLNCLPLVLMLVIQGCNSKEEPLTQHDKINNWIYRQMDLWYLWTDELKSKPATNVYPADFYQDLLVDQDRFSFIYDDYQELINLLNGVQLESGFEFKLYFEPDSEENVILLITYIKKGSPADDAGLRRGDAIYSINGVQITGNNYRSLLDDLESPYRASYRRYDFEREEFIDQGSFDLTPIEVAENPFLLDTIYEVSGKKIAYLVYTRFSNGPTQGSTLYLEQMDQVFANFQSQGISEFILDLRFNSGGSEVSARNLASLVAKATGDDIMFRKQYNVAAQDFFRKDERYGEAFLNIAFADKSENIGSLISNTVYVITSRKSASASELVINSFLPYMEVVVVGDTTVGKDVGSTTFTDQDHAENNWAIQPIIVKTVNSEGEDYPQGIFPDVPLEDNFLFLRPLGDVNEPLLNATLSAIGVQNVRKIPAYEISERRPLFESVGDGLLIFEDTPKRAW